MNILFQLGIFIENRHIFELPGKIYEIQEKEIIKIIYERKNISDIRE